ncbi:ABC transporter permease [Chryseolinea sp. H1M3-3]|uniref:ABC transporter permease n=1 Tax=Chryseolinea sp. H1M3-3 TaxID=3034144 RepID=UPI0023EC4B04|nr:ABC transporter permease [Chryseolinea sp. H1M3-3]
MARDKAYSFINIFGLTVGLMCCLLLALYIQDEMTYDKHHKDVDNLYRVTSIMGEKADHRIMRTTSAPIVWGIKDEIPEIDAVTRLVNPPGVSQNLIRYEDHQFYESDGYIADSTLFKIFNYDFKEGNPDKALVEANSVVITERLATKLFGHESALNKIIYINQGGPSADFKVTGVLAAKQKNSHIEANFFVSMTSSGWAEYLRSPQVLDEWAGQNFMLSYVKLNEGHTAESVLPKMNEVFIKHGADDLKVLGMKKTLGLEPVKDIYLYSTPGDSSPRVTYLYVIGSIAGVILLIACINFMNLSTAKATKRASEVGLRKTLGAYRSSLITQFLGEVMVIVTIAILLSVVLMQVMLPIFNQLTQKQISFDADNLFFFSTTLVVITVVTGLAAGSYPAFYLSSFQPAKVLKGKFALNNSGGLLRKSLVVFQFVVAIVLICGMMVISQQLNFMQSKDLGFQSKQKIILPLRTETAHKNHQSLRNELLKIPSIKDVTATNYAPGSYVWTDFTLYPEGSNMEKGVMVKNNWVEPNYLDVLDIKIIAGRNFTDNRESESQNKIILNRIAVRQLGFEPETIVGQNLYSEGQSGLRTYEVIGVMEDFHQITVKEAVFPMLVRLPLEVTEHDHLVLDIHPDNFQESIGQIEGTWKQINADTPFEYSFLDDDIRKQYEEDKRVSRTITGFTIIAMIISSLGLYGLSTYMAERRFKEIGVRKVMGASVNEIMTMMSSEFVRLVVIAFGIAVPLSLYGIHKWLENFAYKTPVSIWIFIVAGVSALLIAVLTISFQSFKAASVNPINSLRTE